MICNSFFICGGFLYVFPVFDSCVRWFLCVLRNPPDIADTDSSGDTPLAAQNLNTAGEDTPTLGGLRDR